MSDFKKNCTYCDFGDMELMRKNGYDKEEYVYCEKKKAVMEVIEDCAFFSGNHIAQKKEEKMSFLMERMCKDLDEKGFF